MKRNRDENADESRLLAPRDFDALRSLDVRPELDTVTVEVPLHARDIAQHARLVDDRSRSRHRIQQARAA